MCGAKFGRSPGSSEYTVYTFPGEQHSSSILLWNSYNVFARGIEMLSNTPTLHTHAHTRSYSRALALFPCRLFNLPPFFLCCHMKRILQAYTKTKGRSFWRLRKVCQWLFCQQPSHTKVLKTWQRIWSSLDLNIRKDKKTNESQWIKQTTESRWWKRCRGFIYYNTALTPKNNSLINILHNNGINSSLRW